MIENIYDTTLELIKQETKYVYSGKAAAFEMMGHLVKLMGEHNWNRTIQGELDYCIGECKKHKVNKDEWFGQFFFSFHKQFRQTDSFNVEISKDLGRLKPEEIKYWEEYAKKHDYTFETRVVGKNEYQRTVGKLYMHHAAGHLDMLFWGLIHATDKVELIMEYLFDMHIKGYKNFEDYSWSDDYFDFKRSKKKERLTEENE